MKAVIPAAGLGTRFRPWTFGNAKELIPVPDPNNPKNIVATLDLVVREAYEAGCDDICIVTALGKDSIEKHLQIQKMEGHIPSDVDLSYRHQDKPKGLGHAILCARKFVGTEDFAVLLGDDFYENNPTKYLIKEARNCSSDYFGGLITVQKVPNELLSRYGVVKITKPKNSIMRLLDIIEKPKNNPPSNYAVTGRYVFNNDLLSFLGLTKPDAKGEIQLTDTICKMLHRNNGNNYDFYCMEIKGKRYDAGEPAGWMEIINEFSKKLK